MDTDDAPISGDLKTLVFWIMGVAALLFVGMLALVLYALFTRSFAPGLAVEFVAPPAIGVTTVGYLIAGFHRKLQSVSRFRLLVMSVAVFALVTALISALLAFVVAHPSRWLQLVLRLILLVVLILLFRVVWRQRKKRQ